MSDIVLVSAKEFEALYVDGKKVLEQNEITTSDLIDIGIMNFNSENIVCKELDSKSIEGRNMFGYLPNNINAIGFKHV